MSPFSPRTTFGADPLALAPPRAVPSQEPSYRAPPQFLDDQFAIRLYGESVTGITGGGDLSRCRGQAQIVLRRGGGWRIGRETGPQPRPCSRGGKPPRGCLPERRRGDLRPRVRA